MSDTNTMCDQLTREFAENYMEKLFYFCLKKTGNNNDAEDLTQDIALNILTELNKGVIPSSFSAWVWQLARNRYSKWADKKHKRLESVTGSDIGDYEIEDESENPVDEMIRAEQLALLRRELAFIKSDYRNIVVAYYIENRRIRDIASSLSLSRDAVKQRLHRARIILKEGTNMAREFGVRSYKPEQVSFVMNGLDGKKGQPWSIITHLLYKNIFLESYESPKTAEELSLELGIALPYMEDELDFLVRQQLLRKEGNKYHPDFVIVSKEEQKNIFDTNKRIQKPLADKLCEMIDLYMNNDGSKVNFEHVGYEAAKWTLLVRAFDVMYGECIPGDKDQEYPERPDGGKWELKGYEVIDWRAPPFVGQHGYLSHDKNEIKIDIVFSQFKFFYKNIQEKTPTHLSYDEVYTLWLVCLGRTQESEKGYLDKMIEYGYIKNIGDEIKPNVVIFNSNAKNPQNPELISKLTTLKKEICSLISQAPNISRGYVVEQALTNGWLKYDDNTNKTIGAYIYI